MRTSPRKPAEDRGVIDPTRSDKPVPGQDRPAPGAPPDEYEETPDDAVEGRDRLVENEHRPMAPGVTGSSDS